jgi:ketosteroid isomerase-like protein
MSRENVEVVQRLFDAIGRRDSEAVLALYDPEIEWDASRGAAVVWFPSRDEALEAAELSK